MSLTMQVDSPEELLETLGLCAAAGQLRQQLRAGSAAALLANAAHAGRHICLPGREVCLGGGHGHGVASVHSCESLATCTGVPHANAAREA